MYSLEGDLKEFRLSVLRAKSYDDWNEIFEEIDRMVLLCNSCLSPGEDEITRIRRSLSCTTCSQKILGVKVTYPGPTINLFSLKLSVFILSGKEYESDDDLFHLDKNQQCKFNCIRTSIYAFILTVLQYPILPLSS